MQIAVVSFGGFIDLTSRSWMQAAGVQILNRAFVARGHVATPGV